jgi:hypothetical protein
LLLKAAFLTHGVNDLLLSIPTYAIGNKVMVVSSLPAANILPSGLKAIE